MNDYKKSIELSSEWGLQITKVNKSIYTGKGVKIAVLDSGLNFNHPDFCHRTYIARSFVKNETPLDKNGHGTHCAGIIAGPLCPSEGHRYGVAYHADLYIGKVLSDKGNAYLSEVLTAIEWALEEGCRIITISLGTKVRTGVGHSNLFEKTARKALEANTLLIGAAGNDSYRTYDRLRPVAHPANCPSILAVGGINQKMYLYNRSNANINGRGGVISLVAPAEGVRSASGEKKSYRLGNGTSAAASFVAGIAALYMEAYSDLSAYEIGTLMQKQAKSLDLPVRDIGAGLVQAP